MTLMRKSLLFVCMLGFVLTSPRTASAASRTWYVDDVGDGRTGSGTQSDPFRNLQYAIQIAANQDAIYIYNGTYSASPRNIIDPTCGNCDDATYRQNIPVTVGFYIQGKTLSLQGQSRDGVILKTNANYGVFFEDAGYSRIRNLWVTGGVRSTNDAATDSAVIARGTSLEVNNVRATDNTDYKRLLRPGDDPKDPESYFNAGIRGITGRESSNLSIMRCLIGSNSWDGIALYRGASALITDNTLAFGPRNERLGAAIGLTWNSTAAIRNNTIYNWIKGILLAGSGRATVANNLIYRTPDFWDTAWYAISLPSGQNSTVNIFNNTVVNFWYGMRSAGTFTGTLHIENNLFAKGDRPDLGIGMYLVVASSASLVCAYNDVWGWNTNYVLPSTGDIHHNVSQEPRFNNPATYDFQIQCSSPCRDAGAPNWIDFDGSRVDMGAYGGQPTVRRSPVCPTCPGGNTLWNGGCVPLCGHGLYCGWKYIHGSDSCMQAVGNSTPIYCCPSGMRNGLGCYSP